MSYELLSTLSRILSTVIVIALLIWIFRKYLLPAIQSAQDRANAVLSEAEKRRDRERTAVEEARRLAAQAERDAQSVREQGKTVAAGERTRILAEAEDEGTRQVRNAQGELARQRANWRERFRFELIDRALKQARADAQARIDAGANARLVDATIERLERPGSLAQPGASVEAVRG